MSFLDNIRGLATETAHTALDVNDVLMTPFDMESKYIGARTTNIALKGLANAMNPAEALPWGVGSNIRKGRHAAEPFLRAIGENVLVPSSFIPWAKVGKVMKFGELASKGMKGETALGIVTHNAKNMRKVKGITKLPGEANRVPAYVVRAGYNEEDALPNAARSFYGKEARPIVPRELYTSGVYTDSTLETAKRYGANAPRVFMKVDPNARVLDVGTKKGYGILKKAQQLARKDPMEGSIDPRDLNVQLRNMGYDAVINGGTGSMGIGKHVKGVAKKLAEESPEKYPTGHDRQVLLKATKHGRHLGDQLRGEFVALHDGVLTPVGAQRKSGFGFATSDVDYATREQEVKDVLKQGKIPEHAPQALADIKQKTKAVDESFKIHTPASTSSPAHTKLIKKAEKEQDDWLAASKDPKAYNPSKGAEALSNDGLGDLSARMKKVEGQIDNEPALDDLMSRAAQGSSFEYLQLEAHAMEAKGKITLRQYNMFKRFIDLLEAHSTAGKKVDYSETWNKVVQNNTFA